MSPKTPIHARRRRRYVPVTALLLAAAACTKHVVVADNPSDSRRSPYLITWAGDEDREDSDFLAVVDLARRGDRYGTVVATLPTGEKGMWPHHTEHELSSSRMLFANGFSGNRSYLFDVRDPLHPKIVDRFSGAGDLVLLHSFVRLPNGHVIATFQGHGPKNAAPGGIAELDDHGRVVRSRSAGDSSVEQATLRPYSLAVVPSLDRIVVALTYMPIPTWHPLRPSIEHEHNGNQVQVYRLSDLSLIKTIVLPNDDGPNEPRLLPDGRTVLVNTVACKLYRVAGLDGSEPSMHLVHEETATGCAMPIASGRYWIQANAAEHKVFSLDIHDLEHVRLVSSVSFDDRQRPHWLSTDGSRVVVVNEPGASAERRIWMLRFNKMTGQLAIDSAFRDEGSTRPGIAFDRRDWPHGASGTAVPHGTIFWR